MKIGIMNHGVWWRYLLPKWLNTISYKDSGHKQYRWLNFYWCVKLKGKE